MPEDKDFAQTLQMLRVSLPGPAFTRQCPSRERLKTMVTTEKVSSHQDEGIRHMSYRPYCQMGVSSGQSATLNRDKPVRSTATNLPQFGIKSSIPTGVVHALVGKQPKWKTQLNLSQTLMQTTRINSKTKITSLAAAVALLGLGAIQAQAQSFTFNFSDGTSDGWANSGFGSSPLAAVQNIGGNNYISVPLGGFQVANVVSGDVGNLSTFNATMAAAAADPAGYDISYDYYINTAGFSGATYLQVGTYVNSGSGYYAQDYGSPNELQLNGTQLASGGVFQGQITVNMATAGYAIPAADTYFRLGLIENGNGTGVSVDFTDISVTPVTAVPEPASFGLCGLVLAAGTTLIRRRKA
jgi:hypothetical protein